MKSAKQLIVLFFLIAIAGFLTLRLKKDYSIRNNKLSNRNWYAVLNCDKQ